MISSSQIDSHERNSMRPYLDKAIPRRVEGASAYSDVVAKRRRSSV